MTGIEPNKMTRRNGILQFHATKILRSTRVLLGEKSANAAKKKHLEISRLMLTKLTCDFPARDEEVTEHSLSHSAISYFSSTIRRINWVNAGLPVDLE